MDRISIKITTNREPAALSYNGKNWACMAHGQTQFIESNSYKVGAKVAAFGVIPEDAIRDMDELIYYMEQLYRKA